MVRLGELVVILDLHRQGLSVSAIARGVRARSQDCPGATSSAAWSRLHMVRARRRRPSSVRSSATWANGVAAYPELTARRLLRELRDRGYGGGYTAVKEFLRIVRPSQPVGYEIRFETPAGRQAQVDFAHFRVTFADQARPGATWVWLFSLVLAHSRMLWGRFVLHQDMPTLLRCHAAAFEALGGVPEQILYGPHAHSVQSRRCRHRAHNLQSYAGGVRAPLRLSAQGL